MKDRQQCSLGSYYGIYTIDKSVETPFLHVVLRALLSHASFQSRSLFDSFDSKHSVRNPRSIIHRCPLDLVSHLSDIGAPVCVFDIVD